jgi:hypothetical protein
VECPRSEAESARHVHPGAPPPTHADEGVRRHSSPLSEEDHDGNLIRGQFPSTDDRDFLERDLEILADGTEVGLPCPRVDALGLDTGGETRGAQEDEAREPRISGGDAKAHRIPPSFRSLVGSFYRYRAELPGANENRTFETCHSGTDFPKILARPLKIKESGRAVRMRMGKGPEGKGRLR